MADAEFSELDHLVRFIATLVANRFKATELATSGAPLAEAVRKEFPDFSYEKFGISKLADAVRAAEAKGLVQRDTSVQHLAVLPPGVLPRRMSENRLENASPPHIRSDIWRAFVYVGAGAGGYFDRNTGRAVSPADRTIPGDSDRFITIQPISLVVQQVWMEEFLRQKSLNNADAPVRDPYCFAKFPAWLRARDPHLEREWKRFRVWRVAQHVRAWASDHSIAPEPFFAVTAARPELQDPQRVSEDNLVRQALIAAAKELPLDQLKDISIPIRYTLRLLQGR